jgi:hypothetical protein
MHGRQIDRAQGNIADLGHCHNNLNCDKEGSQCHLAGLTVSVHETIPPIYGENYNTEKVSEKLHRNDFITKQ